MKNKPLARSIMSFCSDYNNLANMCPEINNCKNAWEYGDCGSCDLHLNCKHWVNKSKK